MSISDERLEELISKCDDWVRFAGHTEKESLQIRECRDMSALFRELKSLRQAATAGVEEAANKLVRFIGYKISEHLPGDLALRDDESQAVRVCLTALLAPYVAVLRECRVCVDPYPRDEDRQPHRNQLLAKIDALTKGGV